MVLRTLEKFLGRCRVYFQTGHSLVILVPWFITQTTIWYYLLVRNVPALEALLPRYHLFLVMFAAGYVVVTALLGYWYVRRSELFPSEVEVQARQNPWVKDLAQALMLIAQGENQEAVKVLEKWARR